MKHLRYAFSFLASVILCITFLDIDVTFAESKEITFEHTYPATMQVGELSKFEYYVNVYGLEPYVEYDGGVYCETVQALGGEYGGCVYSADQNGNLLEMTDVDFMVYKPGEIIVKLYLGNYDYNFSETYEITRIKVEEPIITHNAPSKVKVGDVIDFTTAITNTAYENRKVSDYNEEKNFLETFYIPSVQVVEGANLVTQSKQDYSNTLNSSEKLSFTGSGTVKLKITYSTMAYDWIDTLVSADRGLIQLSDGTIEKVVTIVVEDDKPVVTVPDFSASETPSTEEPEDIPVEGPIEESTDTTTDEQESENDEAYVVLVDSLIVGKEQLDDILKENANRDVIIKANANIEFTFKKGTMSQVDDKEEYDFGAEIETSYQDKTEYAGLVSKDNFVMQVNFNYNGKLPGEASIKIAVGTDKAGSTLYYSKLCDDGKITFICSAVVDENGILTVSQDSCSDYVITTERIDVATEEDGATEEDSEKPQTDGEKPADSNTWGIISIVIVIIVVVSGMVWVVLRKKENR